jgi:tRNA(Ile)-lysidine synthase
MSKGINPSLISVNETIIMGLSGGPDSVFLLYQLIALQKRVNFTIVAAHLNHEWRPTAIRDQEFCQKLCDSLRIKLVTKKISELNAPAYNNRSQEAQGRYYRKFFLESVQHEYGAHKIFIAHHKDDQLETFFIKLIRGTTSEGMSCLKEINTQYYRPLLHITKEDILSYLHNHAISYVQDESNNDLSFLRNAIRHKLIPLFSEIDHRAPANTLRAIESIQESNIFIDQHVQKTYDFCINENQLILTKFNTVESFLQKKVLLKWLYHNKCLFTPSSAFVEEVLRFFRTQEGGTHQLADSWKLTKKQNIITINL